MATPKAEGGAQAPPCYVFRLIKFDAYGNKVQKRKVGALWLSLAILL